MDLITSLNIVTNKKTSCLFILLTCNTTARTTTKVLLGKKIQELTTIQFSNYRRKQSACNEYSARVRDAIEMMMLLESNRCYFKLNNKKHEFIVDNRRSSTTFMPPRFLMALLFSFSCQSIVVKKKKER